jgi:putative methyltransferase (TIGR04325 family)
VTSHATELGHRILRSPRLRRAVHRSPEPLVRPLRWLWARVGVAEWEYVPEGWRGRTDATVRGWDVPAVAAQYEARWGEFCALVRGPGPTAVIHEATVGASVVHDDLGAHNAMVSYGYVLARAAHARARLSVLDWGGALGHYYVLGRELLPHVDLHYTCKELPSVCARGRRLVPEVRFVSDESYRDRDYDLVLASDSMQYEPEWRSLLERWRRVASQFLFVTRLPVTLRSESFVVLQRAYAYGYETEYLGWVLNRDELVRAAADNGFALEREFVISGAPSIRRAPAPVEVRGFLLRTHPTVSD